MSFPSRALTMQLLLVALVLNRRQTVQRRFLNRACPRESIAAASTSSMMIVDDNHGPRGELAR